MCSVKINSRKVLILSTWQAWADDMSKTKKCSKNITNWAFGDHIWNHHIWNHHEKYIQISTNMPGIGLEMCEILRETKQFLHWCILKTWVHLLNANPTSPLSTQYFELLVYNVWTNFDHIMRNTFRWVQTCQVLV